MLAVLSSVVGVVLFAAPMPERSIVVKGAVIVLDPDFSGFVKLVKTDAGPKLRVVSAQFSLDTSEMTIRANGSVTDVRIDKDGFMRAVHRSPAPGRSKGLVIRTMTTDEVSFPIR